MFLNSNFEIINVIHKNYLFLVMNIFTIPSATSNIPSPVVPYRVELLLAPSWTAKPIIPAMINPPLTSRSTTTNTDFSLSEIAKAIIDKITGTAPKTIPLMAGSKWRKPLCPSLEVPLEEITSAP